MRQTRTQLTLNWILLTVAVAVSGIGVATGQPVLNILLQAGWLGVLAIVQIRRLSRIRPEQTDPAAAVGTLLAHWQYSPEAWTAFVERQYRRTQAKTARPALLLLLLLAFPLLGLAAAGPGFAAVAGTGLIIVIFLAAWIWIGRSRARRNMLRSAPESWIGSDGMYQCGLFTPWRGADRKFGGARIEGGELVFSLEIRGRNREVRALVPAGRESEAETMARDLTTR